MPSTKKLLTATEQEVDTSNQYQTGKIACRSVHWKGNETLKSFTVTSLVVSDPTDQDSTLHASLHSLKVIPITAFPAKPLHHNKDRDLITSYHKHAGCRRLNGQAKKYIYDRTLKQFSVNIKFDMDSKGVVHVLAASLTPESRKLFQTIMDAENQWDREDAANIKRRAAEEKARKATVKKRTEEAKARELADAKLEQQRMKDKRNQARRDALEGK